MKKRVLRFLFLLLIVMMTLSSVNFFACGKSRENLLNTEITMDKSEIMLDLYEETTLKIKSSVPQDGFNAIWHSEDENVVMVNNGKKRLCRNTSVPHIKRNVNLIHNLRCKSEFATLSKRRRFG